MKRLLITGTRYGWNPEDLSFILGYHCGQMNGGRTDNLVLVHGAADGVDRQAAQIWTRMGWVTEAHPADWNTHGKAAGPIRNAEMVALGADQCIAFPGENSRGTWDCVTKAKNAGIPTVTYMGGEMS